MGWDDGDARISKLEINAVVKMARMTTPYRIKLVTDRDIFSNVEFIDFYSNQ